MSRSIVALDNVYENNLGTFSKIINVSLSVQYPDDFFQELYPLKNSKKIKEDIFFSQMGYYGEVAVGGIKAKLINNVNGSILPNGVYIEILAVLQAYRRKGIGSALLMYIEEKCKLHYQHNLYVHVAVDNEVALNWYSSKGFKKEGEVLVNYYKDKGIGSQDAFVLKKQL